MAFPAISLWSCDVERKWANNVTHIQACEEDILFVTNSSLCKLIISCR